MYSEAVTDENYLRGVQETDADGRVQFTTIFPACYAAAGRTCTSRSTSPSTPRRRTRTSCAPRSSRSPRTPASEVYGVVDGYDASVDNLDGVSLDSDLVFSDGYSLQLATVTGSVDEGYTFALNVPV